MGRDRLSASVRDRFDPRVSTVPIDQAEESPFSNMNSPAVFLCADVTARCMRVSELLPSCSLGPSNPPSYWKLRHALPKAERPRKAQGPRRTTRQGEALRRP